MLVTSPISLVREREREITFFAHLERRERTGLVLLPPVTPDMKGGLRRSLSRSEGRAD